MNCFNDIQLEYLEFDTAFDIDCSIDGKNVVAFIVGEYKIPFLFAYQIHFSDGYQGMFIEITPGWWAEQKGVEQVHAKAINDALNQLHSELLLQKIL